MKKVMIAALAVSAALAAFAANMASQKWVEMRMADLEARLNVTRAISPMAVDAGTNGTYYAFFESASEYALSVTNSANSTITNGALFAWNGGGVYTNAALGAITATQTNFVWNGVQSAVVGGVDTFSAPDGFGVIGWRITPTEAKSVKGE
jgi:hypothetical protein